MAEMPKAPSGTARGTTENSRNARLVLANRAARASSTFRHEASDVLQVVEEYIKVAKRRALTGSVRVGTCTEIVGQIVEAELDRYRVEVTRVPVGRAVDEAPAARAEGDVTIIPVVEERLVVVKQHVLVEEIHVRHVLERETVSEPMMLRRQRAVVERLEQESDVDPQRVGDVDDLVKSRD